MASENFFEQKIREIAAEDKVVDLGGGRGFQKGLAHFKKYFKDNYISLDFDSETRPDVVGDVQDLPFKNEEFGALICISVLEHVENPQKAVDEMYRILRKGGKALVYAPFLYSYHAKEGSYQDFFRFSSDGIKYLFRKFSHLEYQPTRKFFEMWFLLFPKIGVYLAPLGRVLDKIIKSKGNQASGFNIFVIK